MTRENKLKNKEKGAVQLYHKYAASFIYIVYTISQEPEIFINNPYID